MAGSDDRKLNGDRPTPWRNNKEINRLRLDFERWVASLPTKFSEQQEAIDAHFAERLKERDCGLQKSLEDINAALHALLDLPKHPPTEESSASHQGMGIILSQKQVVAALVAVSVLAVLLLMGIDGPTIAAWLVKLAGP